MYISTAQMLWDFGFLRGLAPGLLDGFSIGRYKKKGKSFGLSAAKVEGSTMRFSRALYCSSSGVLLNIDYTLVLRSIIGNNKRQTQILQNRK